MGPAPGERARSQGDGNGAPVDPSRGSGAGRPPREAWVQTSRPHPPGASVGADVAPRAGEVQTSRPLPPEARAGAGDTPAVCHGRRRWAGWLVLAPLVIALLPLAGARRALAALGIGRPGAAFRARTLPEALAALGLTDAPPHPGLRLSAPAKAENGAVVPLKVEWDSPVHAVSVLCAGNPVPLIARFELASRVRGRLSTRIKMGRTADITVVAEGADAALRRADLGVEVTIGGCN